MKQNRCSYTILNLTDYKTLYKVWIQGYTKEGLLTSYCETISKHENILDAIKAAEDFEKKEVYKKMDIPEFVKKLELSIEAIRILKDDYEDPIGIMGIKDIKINREKEDK